MIKLRVGLEWFLNPDHVPFLVCEEKGWFSAAGLEVELVEPKEHLDAVEEIENGRMDLAVTEPIHLVADVAAGRDIAGFARFLHTNGGVMYFEGRGIERPRDMAGKRLQYPGAPGPGGPAIVKTMIESDGGAAGAEVLPVNNGFYHTDALIEGKADLATLVFCNFEVIEARHRGFAAQFFALKDWGVPDFCQLILIATPQTLQSRRDAVASFLREMRRGIDFIHQFPEEARELYFRRTGADGADPMLRAIFDATVSCFTFDLSMAPLYYRNLGEWMAATGQVEGAPAPDRCWDNSFAL